MKKALKSLLCVLLSLSLLAGCTQSATNSPSSGTGEDSSTTGEETSLASEGEVSYDENGFLLKEHFPL